MVALDKISLTGFKSICELKDFKLTRLNVLVGANGAGKSNLVDFFRMLRAMADRGLAAFVTNSGGADGFFFNGPKETKQIQAHLCFGSNEYRFTLEPTVAGEMMVRAEDTLFKGGRYPTDWEYHGGGNKESGLSTWNEHKSDRGDWPSVRWHVYKAVSGWTVYHVHDTSRNQSLRRPIVQST